MGQHYLLDFDSFRTGLPPTTANKKSKPERRHYYITANESDINNNDINNDRRDWASLSLSFQIILFQKIWEADYSPAWKEEEMNRLIFESTLYQNFPLHSFGKGIFGVQILFANDESGKK